jgi:hypothetical protein
MSLQDVRLHAPAFAVLSVQAVWEWPDGWGVRIGGRREGSDQYEHEWYGALDSPELLDVVGAVLELKLGL